MFWSIFGKFIENFFFRHISDYLGNEHWNTQKVCFSYHIWKGQIQRIIWICLNNCFWSNLKNVINTNKNVFLHNVSHILLNNVFLLFWSIFVEIHRELFFLDIKVAISEMSTEILRIFFFNIFEMGKSWGKFEFV